MIAILMMMVCVPALAQPKEDTPERAVWDLLSEMHEASKTADVGYFDLFADDAVFFGTDLWERWTKAEFEALYKPYMESGRGWEFKMRDRRVDLQPCGTIALFDETLFSESYGPCRGSGAARLDGGEWKLVRYHLDITIPNGVVDEVVPVIEAYEAERIEVLATNRMVDNLDAVADMIRGHLPDVVAFGNIQDEQLERVAALTVGYESVMIPSHSLGLNRVVTSAGTGVLFRADRFARAETSVVYGDAPGSEWWRTKLHRRNDSGETANIAPKYESRPNESPSFAYDVAVWRNGETQLGELQSAVQAGSVSSPDQTITNPLVFTHAEAEIEEFETLSIEGVEFHRAIIRLEQPAE